MEKFSLAGEWRLYQIDGEIVVPMAIPGDILSALVAGGIAPDPYSGRNEDEVRWVGGADWRVEREFEVPPALLACERIFLDIEVIDTVASVEINGTRVGDNTSMFTRFRRDLTSALKKGKNLISISIRSPEKAAADIAATLPYPIPESTYPSSSPHRNLLRKAQCMSGWDWGPCLMTGGIYDGIELVGIDGPRIDYVRASIVAMESFDLRARGPAPESGPDFKVEATIDVNSLSSMEALLSASLAGEKRSRRVQLPAGDSALKMEFCVKKPLLWWPEGIGAQPLYDLEVSLGASATHGADLADTSLAAASPHIVRKRIGFRELIVSTAEDSAGREMKFVANGREIFAKGANWIPADALPSRCTKEKIAGLLGSAVEAHMNCLRVWGGGRYECDAFYDLCNELGILVWQDCMFSCALYPSTPAFLAEVEEEIRHQVKRLQCHPSVALWCGGNEALGAITWYEESKRNPARYIVDYDRLTEGLLGKVVRELDPGRCWWPSSPSAGPNDFSDNWHSDERGDMHFWSVWHEGKPFSEYLTVRPRFCSEFGFQAFPGHETIVGFAPPDERNISSPTMEAHQRHPRGNSLIIDTMLRYFRMPKGFRETLYLSQVQQAMAIGTAVEYWRSERPRCMGTLYWQLNDVWPATSWSSIEYGGMWKLLHYEARRFYDPLLLAFILRDGNIELRVVNDSFFGMDGSFEISFVDFTGRLLASHKGDRELPPEGARTLWSMPLKNAPESPERCFIEARLSAYRPPRNPAAPTGESRRRAWRFLTEPKRCSLVEANIVAQLDKAEEGRDQALYMSIVARDAPAFHVAPTFQTAPGLPCPRGRFEDAGFYLSKGESRRLRFIPEKGFEATARASTVDLSSQLLLFDLRSSYE
ncbi:MAG TPA: glycoside hydrolase family 2 protein [Rectinemataceae bacterium]|nr:glycoside hydrolase family 2 protein [Rectinemataceae bacterium]